MKNKRILVVEDSVVMRLMVAMTLRGAGYEPVEATDGIDALSKLDGQTFHLVLSDVNMPRLDGIALIKEIRRIPAYQFLPVVMLTTEGSSQKMREGREAGVLGWIVKPFKQEQLVRAVASLLRA